MPVTGSGWKATPARGTGRSSSTGRPGARALAAKGRGSRSPGSLHPASRTWPLYWRDRHLRFHLYDELEPSPGIGGLLREIDRDPVAIFWG